mgnify:CR=1 FL=1|jgi:hypothetical protein
MLNAIQMGIITASTKQRLATLEEQKAQLEEQILQERIKNPALSREQIAFFLDQYKKTDITDETQRQRARQAISHLATPLQRKEKSPGPLWPKAFSRFPCKLKC